MMAKLDLYKKFESKLTPSQMNLIHDYMIKARDYYFNNEVEQASTQLCFAVAALKHNNEFHAAEVVLSGYYYLTYWED